MSKWINVNERLPADADGRVVALNSAGYSTCVTFIYWVEETFGFCGEDVTAEESNPNVISNITHWMPLPELPIVSPISNGKQHG